MQTAEIQRRLADLLRRARPHRRAVRVARHRRPRPAVHGRRHGAVHPVPHRRGARALSARRRACRSASAPTTSRRSARRPRHGTFFQMNGNLSLRRLLQGAGDRATPGSCSPPRRADGGLGFDQKDLWVTVYEDDDEAIELLEEDRRSSRRAHPAPRQGAQLLVAPGSRARQVPAPRSSSTAVPRTASTAAPPPTTTRYVEIWNLVFMQYLIAERAARRTTSTSSASCRRRTSTPAWAWSASRSSSRASRTCTRSTRCVRCSTRAVELSGRPLRRGPRGRRADARHRRPRALVAHAHDRRRDAVATRAAGTSCGGSCAASSARCACSGVDAPTLRRAVRRVPPRHARRVPGRRGGVRPHRRDWRSPRRRRSCAPSRAAPRSWMSPSPRRSRRAAQALAGDTAFLLHDTFGFPIDLTLEIAEEAGLTSTATRSTRPMHRAAHPRQGRREGEEGRARRPVRVLASSARRARRSSPATTTSRPSPRPRHHRRRASAQIAPSRATIAEVILAESSLYAGVRRPGGRQGHDRRRRVRPRGARRADARSRGSSATPSQVRSGEVAVGDAATTVVDPRVPACGALRRTRRPTSIHAALRQTLGQEAHQSGLVQQGRLHAARLLVEPALCARRPAAEIEEIANNAVRDNLEVDDAHPAARRGEGARGDGPLRREVRRHRADGRDRRTLVARAVRAAPMCAPSAEVGLVNLVGESIGRLHQPPRRGARRPGRVPRPRGRAGDRESSSPRRSRPPASSSRTASPMLVAQPRRRPRRRSPRSRRASSPAGCPLSLSTRSVWVGCSPWSRMWESCSRSMSCAAS